MQEVNAKTVHGLLAECGRLGKLVPHFEIAEKFSLRSRIAGSRFFCTVRGRLQGVTKMDKDSKILTILKLKVHFIYYFFISLYRLS